MYVQQQWISGWMSVSVIVSSWYFCFYWLEQEPEVFVHGFGDHSMGGHLHLLLAARRTVDDWEGKSFQMFPTAF